MSDLQHLLSEGIILDGVNHQVIADCFVCDAPARAYLKNVKSFSGYFGCDKCCIEGDYIERPMTFPNVNCKLRTDGQFL